MKQKRKTQPDNLKRYWISFSLLAILLMIPFKILNHTLEMNIFYGLVSLLILTVLVRFITQYGWRTIATFLLMVCLILSLSRINYQYKNNLEHALWNTACLTQRYSMPAGIIFESIWCHHQMPFATCDYEFIRIRHTPLVINANIIPDRNTINCG